MGSAAACLSRPLLPDPQRLGWASSARGWSPNGSGRRCHQPPSRHPLWWRGPCIEEPVHRPSPLKTENGIPIAGVLRRPGDTRDGQIRCPGVWNLRLERGHAWHPDPRRPTACASVQMTEAAHTTDLASPVQGSGPASRGLIREGRSLHGPGCGLPTRGKPAVPCRAEALCTGTASSGRWKPAGGLRSPSSSWPPLPSA